MLDESLCAVIEVSLYLSFSLNFVLILTFGEKNNVFRSFDNLIDDISIDSHTNATFSSCSTFLALGSTNVPILASVFTQNITLRFV